MIAKLMKNGQHLTTRQNKVQQKMIDYFPEFLTLTLKQRPFCKTVPIITPVRTSFI